jgi:hypothetical protein
MKEEIMANNAENNQWRGVSAAAIMKSGNGVSISWRNGKKSMKIIKRGSCRSGIIANVAKYGESRK